MRWTRGDYFITDAISALDIPMVHDFLTNSYWARGIDLPTVKRSIEHSLSLGIFSRDIQVGFGRAVTDRATFAYLADIFVLPAHRRRGLAHWLVDCFLEHPELRGVGRWLLATADAHAIYARKGFHPLRYPERFMELSGAESPGGARGQSNAAGGAVRGHPAKE